VVWQSGRYSQTKKGFYILQNKVITHCRIQYADILYFISYRGEVTELARNITHHTNLCY
jgi:hypothetical protein